MSHYEVDPVVTVPPTRPDPLTTSIGHPIHPTSSTSTPQRATMDGTITADDARKLRARLLEAVTTRTTIGEHEPEATTHATDSRPVTFPVAHVGESALGDVAALSAWVHREACRPAVRAFGHDPFCVTLQQLRVELERVEGDLAVAVREASAARAELAVMTPGAAAIVAERRRQVDVEGYTAEHDERHDVHHLVLGAVAYLGKGPWPFLSGSFKFSDRDGYYVKRDLVKAGALVAAAIDRLRATADEDRW